MPWHKVALDMNSNILGARIDKDQPALQLYPPLPAMHPHNLMVWRPSSLSDEQMYSTQFYAPDAVSIFSLSPARIDPTLHEPGATFNQDASSKRDTERLICSPIKGRPEQPSFLSPMAMWGLRPHDLASGAMSGSPSRTLGLGPTPGPLPGSTRGATKAAIPGRIAKQKTGNKRYQYWTVDEDNLVKFLREDRSWTWKDISRELQRELGGIHTWQAVQMRYLRALRSRDGAPAAPHEQEAAGPPKRLNMELVEEKIKKDWQNRWGRLGATIGADISSADCTELLASPSECVRAFVDPEN